MIDNSGAICRLRSIVNSVEDEGIVPHEVAVLNNGFGACLNGVTKADLGEPAFQRMARELWAEHGGLLAVRGDDLIDLQPAQMCEWAGVFGRIDEARVPSREHLMVSDTAIMRIGNVRDESGNLKASFARVPALTSDADVQYNPQTRRPVWHTDSTFKPSPPIGSVFHCKMAPQTGGDTLFANTSAAYNALDADTRASLGRYEAVCSLAHHDKKINSYSPDYPILTPAQRAANPPQRVPVVLNHPVSGKPAIYGLNSSTCAVVDKGAAVSDADMDAYDLDGVEDDSVQILRGLLPHITGPAFTVRWRWQPGDVVVWDNRSTMHAGTGYEHDKYEREMWRLTLL